MSKKTRRHFSDNIFGKLAGIILAFILSLLFLVLTVLLILRFGLFSEGQFLSLFDNTYFRMNMEYIDDRLTDFNLPTNVDASVLEGVFSQDVLAGHVISTVRSYLTDTVYEPDLTAEKQLLTDRMHQFLDSNNVTFEGDEEAVIKEYVSDVCEIYLDGIELPGMGTIAEIRSLYLRYDWILLAAAAVLTLLFVMICIRTRHYAHHGIRDVALAAGGTGLICIVVPAYLLYSGFYKRLNLRPEFFYHFAVTLIVYVLKAIVIAGLVWIGIMIVLGIITAISRAALIRKLRRG